MRVLKNFDIGYKYYNIDTGIEFEDNHNLPFNGWYKSFSNKLIGVLVQILNLYLLVNSNKYLIDDKSKLIIESRNDKSVSLIFENNIEKVLFNVELIKNNVIISSPFEYLEEDDFKWEEFLLNIINNSDSKKNLIDAFN